MISPYIALMKLRVVELLLVTTLPALFLAAEGIPPLDITIATLLGGTLAAGAANAFNMIIESDIDQLMGRTSKRPIVNNKITENPVPEEEPRISEPTELEARCHWRAEGVYQAIMNEKGDEFYIMHKDHYKEKEFQDLCILVKNATKEVALNIIRRLLSTLKKRKYRNNKSHLTNTIS